MRAAGSAAWTAIRSMDALGTQLAGGASAATRAALAGMMDVMWAYGQCMALELEASRDQVPIDDLQQQVKDSMEHPWEPAEKPETINAIVGGRHRLDAQEADADRSLLNVPVQPDDPADAPGWDEEQDHVTEPEREKDPDKDHTATGGHS